MVHLPRISIIVPTRNRAAELKRMLDRLLESDYPDYEVIVVDGASTDGTVPLLESYGGRLAKWISEPDGGEFDADNKGLTFAAGEIIKFMSDDDVLLPWSLEIAGRFFLAHPEVDVLFGQQKEYLSTPDGDLLLNDKPILDERSLTLRNWLRRSLPTPSHMASFLRRRVIDDVGPMSTTYWPGDVEFWARVARVGKKMALVPDHFVDYYKTGENASIKRARECQIIFYHAARLYGDRSDVRYVVFRIARRLIVHEIRRILTPAAHAVGFHPERRRLERKARKRSMEGRLLKGS